MATLIHCQAIRKAYAERTLFRDLTISFEDRERTGLIGPNGAGKSTLLRILSGQTSIDAGELRVRRGLRVAYVPQDEPLAEDQTVLGTLCAALSGGTLDEHDRHTQATVIASRLEFPQIDQPIGSLSGGWRKRLSIACGLIQEPDLLLLDEPTNHLDVAAVLWLEDLLLRATFPFVVVTHDRYFLERIVTRMVELSPAYSDGCFSVSGSYRRFLEKRDEFLAGQRTTQAAMASRARREIAFLDSHSKAQRTKSKARIEDAHELLAELADLRQRNNLELAAGIDFDATGRQSRKLLHARGVSKSFGGRLLFSALDVLLSPGARLGLLGANGAGKTTLIRVLTGQVEPDAGDVKRAPNLRVVIFDQKRQTLPRDVPLREALAGKLDFVIFRGHKIHVHGWAERFLFRQAQLNTQVGDLSGGEQARIQIARLMLEPADVLILDEPTNDLDIPSLDVLEESLLNFPGAIVLVTHDRYMLDRVCTEMLGLCGEGRVARIGSVAEWEAIVARDIAARRAEPTRSSEPRPSPSSPRASPAGPAQRGKLTYKEKQELQDMEAAVAAAEIALAQCQGVAHDPVVCADHRRLAEACTALETAQAKVDQLYVRWHELEAKLDAGGAGS